LKRGAAALPFGFASAADVGRDIGNAATLMLRDNFLSQPAF